MNRTNGHAAAGLMALMAMTLGCQTEQSLQQSPLERGEQRPGRTMLAETELVERVRMELAHEPLLAPTAIRVDGHGGTLRLRGVVHTGAQHSRAIDIARASAGVKRIDNQLIRRGRSGVTDGPLPDTQLQL